MPGMWSLPVKSPAGVSKGPREGAAVLEVRPVAHLDDHAGDAVGLGPYDRRAVDGVAALDAVQDRPAGGDEGGRAARGHRRGRDRAERARLQQAPTIPVPSSHVQQPRSARLSSDRRDGELYWFNSCSSVSVVSGSMRARMSAYAVSVSGPVTIATPRSMTAPITAEIA